MSQKAKLYRTLAQVVDLPEGAALLKHWLTILTPIAEAAKAGDLARAHELLDDWEAKALLQSALPGWEWGDCGDGAHLDAGGRHFTGWA